MPALNLPFQSSEPMTLSGRAPGLEMFLLPANAPEIVARAMAAGAGDWCAKVRAARRARRAHAAQARRDAERANAARNARRPHPGQQWLFEAGF